MTAWKEGTVIVLEPRRVAARLLARRVAEEMGVSLGQEVGYHVRFDRKYGPKTRLLFVTDGILLRRMLNDPELDGVSAVIFDEVHERHLESDLTLSLLREQVKGARTDLSLVVMSATLDLETLEERLGPCPVLNAEGRMYPVELHYLERNLNPKKTPIWEAAADACAEALREQGSGSVLVFMPGQREIHRTLEACRRKGLNQIAELLELHGGLPLDLQAKTLREGDARKVIVSTNIAESSVTVPNVSAVVDSGLVRMARFDAGRAMDTLHIQPISQSSADQRSGRAGRTRPGIAYRLWTESAHQAKPAHTPPEIHRCDLAPSLLQIAALRKEGLDAFPWFEPPEDARLEQARKLLQTLKAVEDTGQISRLGRDLAQLPVHPRYARFLLYAQEHGGLEDALTMVSLAQAGRILLKTKSWEIKRQRELKLPEETDCDAF
jgi:ATP-dependent helicase HrpB